jgi:sialate O-acetylesterase
MVLQRDMPVRIWGTAGAGEKVTVEFAGQKVSTVTGADGKWNLELAPMKASKENRVMTVTGSRPDESKWQNGFGMFASENVSNEIKIKDVLVGEVWMCAGQSNTDCPIWGNNPRYRDGNGSMMVQMTKKPWVRLVKTRRNASLTALDDYPVDWVPMTPEAISAMGKMPSAMGYYFALEIANALDIPVGLVDSSWGGTDVLAWAPRSGIESRQDLKDILEWRYVAMDKWTKANRKGVVSGAHQQPSVLWNGMVAMYAPMSVPR